ncbi:unnamed protein product [Arabis nemorensis]|uniref:Uncharacterized protein n=1 Tax=Arabis nemorensis TaxID=586526 RepID=A0A565AXL3_9BRAS|nr:unnamed protein product [Arabis nemorensis]
MKIFFFEAGRCGPGPPSSAGRFGGDGKMIYPSDFCSFSGCRFGGRSMWTSPLLSVLPATVGIGGSCDRTSDGSRRMT